LTASGVLVCGILKGIRTDNDEGGVLCVF